MALYHIRLAPVVVIGERSADIIEPAATLEISGDTMSLFSAVEGDYYQIKSKGAVIFLCSAAQVSYCFQVPTEIAQVVPFVTEGENRG